METQQEQAEATEGTEVVVPESSVPPSGPPAAEYDPEPPEPVEENWEQIADEGAQPLAEDVEGADDDNSPEALAREEGQAAANAESVEPVVGGEPVEVEAELAEDEAQAMECQICGTLYTGLPLGAGRPTCGHSYGNYRPVVVVKREA